MSDDPANPPPDIHQPLPDALRSHVAIREPNESIPLFQGMAIFSQAGVNVKTDSIISLRWLPSPAIYIEVPIFPRDHSPQLDEFYVQPDGHMLASKGFVTGIPMSHEWEGFLSEPYRSSLTGIITERVVSPADESVAYVTFLLPNFDQPIGRGVRYPDGSSRATRLTLIGGGWIFTLDAADPQKNAMEHLKTNSGFGITQIGRLEKEDKSPFTAKDALVAIRALAWYVSFAAGRWTGPCLPAGFDANGNEVWQVWEYNRTVPFRHRISWVDKVHPDHLEGPFPGFMRLWLDDTWQEILRISIHWYIEANAQAGSIEGSIVLTQTAFELLASAILVDHNAWLSQDGCDKIAAADRIRLLFIWAGISTGIPDKLSELIKLSKSFEDFMLNKIPDAAASMTTIRNTITHPTRRNREKFGKHSDEARLEAWTLGLRNLELCLLKLFNHRGTYADRINQKWQGEITTVPWA